MKFFSKDSLWILCSNVVKLIFGFLIVPIIGRSVLPEQLGKLDLLLAYGPFINQFISMVLTNSSTKFYKEKGDVNIIKYMQHKIGIRACVWVLLYFILFSLFGAQKMNIPIIIVILYSISLFLENISFFSSKPIFKYQCVSKICHYNFNKRYSKIFDWEIKIEKYNL